MNNWPGGSQVRGSDWRPSRTPTWSAQRPSMANGFVRLALRCAGVLVALASLYIIVALGTLWGGVGVVIGFLVMGFGLWLYWLGWKRPTSV